MQKFASEIIDAATEAAFPHPYSDAEDGTVRVERAVGRVVGRDLPISAEELDEVDDEAVAEEYDELSPEDRQTVDRVLGEAVIERRKVESRRIARAILRGIVSEAAS